MDWNKTACQAVETRCSGNVFADLGFEEPEARVYKMRSELMIAIEKMIADQHLSQTEAAQMLKVSRCAH